MDDLEQLIRRRAYELWEQAGRPHGRSDEFWHAARAELNVESAKDEALDDPRAPPIEEPPEIAAEHGVPVGMPGERIVEQGVIDDDGRLEDLLDPILRRSPNN
jgi:hypothetical protein